MACQRPVCSGQSGLQCFLYFHPAAAVGRRTDRVEAAMHPVARNPLQCQAACGAVQPARAHKAFVPEVMALNPEFFPATSVCAKGARLAQMGQAEPLLAFELRPGAAVRIGMLSRVARRGVFQIQTGRVDYAAP